LVPEGWFPSAERRRIGQRRYFGNRNSALLANDLKTQGKTMAQHLL
jgi:hypothetical protein